MDAVTLATLLALACLAAVIARIYLLIKKDKENTNGKASRNKDEPGQDAK